MSIKFLILGGVFWVWGGGGGECRFYFYGRRDFSDFIVFKKGLNFKRSPGGKILKKCQFKKVWTSAKKV